MLSGCMMYDNEWQGLFYCRKVYRWYTVCVCLLSRCLPVAMLLPDSEPDRERERCLMWKLYDPVLLLWLNGLEPIINYIKPPQVSPTLSTPTTRPPPSSEIRCSWHNMAQPPIFGTPTDGNCQLHAWKYLSPTRITRTVRQCPWLYNIWCSLPTLKSFTSRTKLVFLWI